MILRCLFIFQLCLFLAGCAAPARLNQAISRQFQFPADTFAYPNELTWEYRYDEQTGRMISRRRQPPPDYTLHCFVLARSARQFFQFARFDPSQPKVGESQNRHLIRQVVSRNPRRDPPAEGAKIVIPGYAGLREFSKENEALLKAEAGGAWQSYCQRGNWRIVFPFTRGHQERLAAQLVNSLVKNRPPVVHLVRFPQLTINHAIVVFDFAKTDSGIEFRAYDPNVPGKPATLLYNERTRTFELPRNHYFAGGRVDVYQIYHAVNY